MTPGNNSSSIFTAGTNKSSLQGHTYSQPKSVQGKRKPKSALCYHISYLDFFTEASCLTELLRCRFCLLGEGSSVSTPSPSLLSGYSEHFCVCSASSWGYWLGCHLGCSSCQRYRGRTRTTCALHCDTSRRLRKRICSRLSELVSRSRPVCFVLSLGVIFGDISRGEGCEPWDLLQCNWLAG